MNNGPGRFGRWDLKTGFIPACDYASTRGLVPRKKARPVWGRWGKLPDRALQRAYRATASERLQCPSIVPRKAPLYFRMIRSLLLTKALLAISQFPERLENQDKRQQKRDQGQHPDNEDHQEKITHFDHVRCGMIFPSVD
jgi:hypothetical protein